MRQVVVLGRMIIPHPSKGGHELEPPGIIDFWLRRIGWAISPEQHAQMVPVHGIHARRKNEAEAAIVHLGIGEPRGSTNPAHGAIHNAPRGRVRLPAIEIDPIEYLYAVRISRFPASRLRGRSRLGWFLFRGGTAAAYRGVTYNQSANDNSTRGTLVHNKVGLQTVRCSRHELQEFP